MDYQLGKISGQAYGVIHIDLSAKDRVSAAVAAADKMKPKDRPEFIRGFYDGYDAMNKDTSSEQGQEALPSD